MVREETGKKGSRSHDRHTARRCRRASLNEISGYVYVLSSLMEANQKLVTERSFGETRSPMCRSVELLRDEGTQWIFVEGIKNVYASFSRSLLRISLN